MTANTSHTPDGRGVLIYNGEMILVYSKEVNLNFDKTESAMFKGSKRGRLYLTSHRVIFTNMNNSDSLVSLGMPFHCLRDVKLEQPILGANYLKGAVLAQPNNGNFVGQVVWKLTFNKGGCIDFGRALLNAVAMAGRFRPYDAPPAYAPPASGTFCAPPSYYSTGGEAYNGFVPPTQAFPDQPEPGEVHMYEAPPPYSGIGPDRPPPYPAGQAAVTANGVR